MNNPSNYVKDLDEHRHCAWCGKPIPATLIHSDTPLCSIECERLLAEAGRDKGDEAWIAWLILTYGFVAFWTLTFKP